MLGSDLGIVRWADRAAALSNAIGSISAVLQLAQHAGPLQRPAEATAQQLIA